MLQCLPKQVAMGIARGVAVVEAAVESRGRETIDVRQQLALDLRPAGAQAGQIGELIGAGQRWERAAAEALKPKPLRTHDVCQSALHRPKTRSKVLRELLAGKRVAGIQHPPIGPGTIRKQSAGVLGCDHAFLLCAQLRRMASKRSRTSLER